jgi:hypothetical protein
VSGARRRSAAGAPARALEVAEDVRTRTLTFLLTEIKDRLAGRRDRDITRVVGNLDDDSSDALTRRAAALRKRFERLKEDLRESLRHE